MIWEQRDMDHLSRPYRICWETRGYSVWVYAENDCRCLGREVTTLAHAKSICEEHARSKVAA